MLSGIIPILPTPFDNQGEVDLISLRNLVDFLIDRGVHGLGTLALGSESYKLTDTERGQIIRTVIAAARRQVPVVVGADHTGTTGAIQRCKESEALGADAVMVLPPYFIKPDQAGLFGHYAALSRAVSIPLIVQDTPGLTGLPMPISFLYKLASELERVEYVKIEEQASGPKISAVVREAGEQLKVLSGWGGLTILDSLRRGAIGCMPGADFAPSLVQVYKSFQAGDISRANGHFTAILPLMNFAAQSLDMLVIIAKVILFQQGVISSPYVRQPAIGLDEIYQTEFQELFGQTSAAMHLTSTRVSRG
jgi:2-keto-3-deoxy-L-arabinonate dehydratase